MSKKQKLELTWVNTGRPQGGKKPFNMAFSGVNAAPWTARLEQCAREGLL